jgi:peroxiredoxin
MTCRHGWASAATIAVVIAVSNGAVSAERDETAAPLQQSISVIDCGGNLHVLQAESQRPAAVFVFLTAECPISASYLPRLNELAKEWRSQNVSLFGIWADPTDRPGEVAALRSEYQIQFPVLMDRDGTLARRFQPSHVPEAFVINSKGHVAYQGRIDDRYRELGHAKPSATKHDLADAVASLLEGRAIEVAHVPSVGCKYETLPESERGEITFCRDIAPILYANCVVCHRDGEVGPFPLVSYEDVAKRAGQIAEVAEARLMPPWKPAQIHGEFLGQRTLSEQQIKTLAAWEASGRAKGDPEDLPPAPQFASGWRLGPPDLVLEMPVDFEVPADGTDVFQNFVIPVELLEDKTIAAADFAPGNPRVVHHSLFFLDGSGEARKLDAATPEPGYGTFGTPGFLPAGSAGGWSPGKTPRRLPDGLGRRLKKDWDLVLQVHYHPSGKPEKDRSKVALYFADNDATIAADVWASSHMHNIPPGEKDYRLSASYTLPRDVQILGVVPHMHLLGRTMAAKAVLPDGTERELISIPDWDFNWQDDYRLAEPFDLPAGTRLHVDASYDNSDDNPSNPHFPSQRVLWGEGTGDEMLYCFFLIATEEPEALRAVLSDRLKQEALGQITGRLITGRGLRPRLPGQRAQTIQQTGGTAESPKRTAELTD